ncbi:TraG family conjugative transposon ATPase [Pontibacter virosus]|uniref:Conjugation system TraG family ATPase n=1 Tax=Pontibacter virosus TaxID=1765052 RepID=A0A2U1AWV5_9BACT|nr:TraG family conjugative transposon ATPase [Pontibacter virosus]PVY40915.1 conjugation system TraG family ATPase [Pontibacter virosus]
MAAAVELERLLPIYGVEQDTILSRRGDTTLAFELTLPEIFTLSDQEYEAFHQALVKAIRLLPRHCVLHKQDWFVESAHQADFQQEGQGFLSRASERFFHERPFFEHHCYVLLTKIPEDVKPSSSLLSSLLRRSIAPQQTLQPQLFQEFVDQAGQFVRVLEDSGFVSLRRLPDDELTGTLERAGLLERYCGLLPAGSAPLLQDIHFREGLRIGDQHCLLFTLADAAHLPALCGSRVNYDRYSTDRSRCSTGFASPLGQLLPCNHLLNQYIFTGDAPATLERLESKRLRLQSLAAYSRGNALAREAAQEFLHEAVSQQRLPVKAHFNILAWTAEPGKLKELRNTVSSAIAQLDAAPKLETDGAPQLFWAGLPGNAGDFPMNETFDTFLEQACCFLNLETAYRSSRSPIGLRLGDRLTGRPLHVDISDEPVRQGICTNRNKFILGPSGSGKSFFTNHLVRSYHEQGAHIVLVDVGHSYKGLCELVNGYYFTYDAQCPLRFNPFYLGKGDALDTEKKESIKTLLLALWKKDSETFTRAEYVALSNALELYYRQLEARPALFPCFDTFYEFVKDGFRARLQADGVKEKDFDLDNFLYVLRPYYRGGEFDFLLNARQNLELLQERFIVFELDNIKDHPILFPVVTIIIMEVFISKMRKLQGVRKVILIEEAWKAIAREGMAEYIRYLFKTVRKFYGEAIVVTQEVEDIISSPIVKQAIIHNSDCKILLDQRKYLQQFDGIQQLLGLTEKEKALVLSVNRANDPARTYKEVFISLGGVLSKVYRTEVSLEEYLAYTTEEKEKLQVQEYAARWGGDIAKGIAELAQHIRTQKEQPHESHP